MAADRAGGWSTWSECFADRNRWAPLAREPWPQVWSQICSELQLDPQTELELAKPWIIWLQNRHHEASTFREPRVEFLMVSDVINYLQTHWGYAKRWLPARYNSPRHASDTNICFDRSLSGDHFQRLVSIVMARHVWATIDGTPPQSSVLRELSAELRFPQRSPIEDWWLKRRLMQWPADCVAREPRDSDCDADEGADGYSREALTNLWRPFYDADRSMLSVSRGAWSVQV
jgi:hypothetical protein